MKGQPEERAVLLAEYIIDHDTTVRSAAAAFGVSKSTVHKDVTKRLWHCNRALAKQVGAVLARNKAQRHIRGGEATKQKYLQKESRVV